MSNGINFREMAVSLRGELTSAQSELSALHKLCGDRFNELAALREELARKDVLIEDMLESNSDMTTCLAASEQRNSELCKLLLRVQGVCLFSIPDGMHSEIDAVLKPTESGASE